MTLEETINLFEPLDNRTRLEMLLAYSEELPPLPPERAMERDSGEGRVHECQTPVWLWVDVQGGIVHIDADAAPEAPTVRGFIGLLVDVLNGRTANEALAIPSDLVSKLGLTQALGMMRTGGLSGIVQRIKREVKKQLER